VGQVYPNGTIKIIDRSKNIFKLSQGEYLAPEKLENAYIQSELVTQILIYGDSFKNCAVGIVVPDEVALENWAKGKGIEPDKVYEDQDEYAALVLASIHDVAKAQKFNSLEKPKKILLVKEPFSVENDMLTPTFKMKRNVAKKVYQSQIDEMYVKLAELGQ
jgi:long-chain acyl-CoA synthetase